MEKINLVELLKYCPKGMELDCAMFENVVFDAITDNNIFPISLKRIDGFPIILTKYGEYANCPSSKCVIFPKGKTTWEGFVPPCKFKDGDIIYVKDKYNQEWCSILSNDEDSKLYTYIDFCINNNTFYHNKPNILCEHKYIIEYRLSTEEEKEKLFNAIKDKGYRWDDKTKTLEKLTKFYKEETKNNAIFDYNAQCCDITNNLIKEENETLKKVIKPKFPEGVWVVDNYNCVWKIKKILNQFYILESIEGGELRLTIDWVDKTFHLWTIQDANDGDVLCYKDEISLYKHDIKNCTKQETTFSGFVYHCCYDGKRFIMDSFYSLTEQDKMNIHPATKEQRDLLFTKMKEVGYGWDKETKTFKEVIKPIFRVGNRIRLKSKHNCIYTVFCLAWGDNNILAYKLLPDNDKHLILVSLNKQDNYELVPNKFDINTLIPFESKVLVRDNDAERWRPTIWGFYDNDDAMNYPYECIGDAFAQCIPYEGNEDLLGTNNNCDDFYKTWK